MKFDVIKDFTKDVVKEAGENKSALYACGAIACLTGTLVTTIIATYRLKEILDENDGKVDKHTAMKIGKLYFIPVAFTIGGVICIVSEHKADVAKYTALLAAHAVDSKTLDNKLKEGKEEKISEVKGAPKNDKEKDISCYRAGDTTKIWDEHHKRFLITSIDSLIEACSEANEELIGNDVVTVNSFYEYLDYFGESCCTDNDYNEGWKGHPVSIELGSHYFNGETYLSFNFKYAPKEIDCNY